MRERGAGSGLSPAAVRETTALPRPPRPANSEHDVKPDLDKSLLVSAQYVSEGNGGIAEVARLTAAGHSTKTIALKLQIGVKSVETYKTRYMSKLGFQSRVELVNYAIGKGWLGEP